MLELTMTAFGGDKHPSVANPERIDNMALYVDGSSPIQVQIIWLVYTCPLIKARRASV
jgi:hypothetical protein